MTLIIAYATVEGQTGKIARFVNERSRAAGHDTLLVDVGRRRTEVDFDDADRVVLAASVHERRHPEAFEVFVAAHRDALNARRTLLLSVSLSAAFPEGHEEAQDYVDEMKMRTGLQPGAEMLVAGAVRTSHYDYFAQQVVRHVVMRGRSFDPETGEHEFTDWDAVAAKLDAFLATGDTAHAAASR